MNTLTQTERDALIAAEQSVLGGLLINPVALEEVFDLVGPQDFFSESHRLIAEAIQRLSERRQALDVVTLADELDRAQTLSQVGSAAYLIEIYENTPGASNIRAYARTVADHAHRRQVLSALDEAGKAVYTAPLRPVEEIVSDCQATLADLEKSRDAGAGPQQLDAAAKEVLKDWQALDAGETVERIHTGWSTIDKRWKGLRGGELAILAGTSGTGKTVFAVQMATHCALQDQRVLMFSLEMSRRELYRRMVGMMGRCPIGLADSDEAEDRRHFYATHSEALSVAVAKLKGIAMDVDDQGALHINQIASRARRAHRKNPLSLIVVDYLQLIRGDGQSREREVASVSAGLKALAKELDVPVLALSQFNRQAQQGKPHISQLRDSGSIEQDADLVALLYREDRDNPDCLNPGLVEVNTAKHRRGEPGTDLLMAKLSQFRLDLWSGDVIQQEETPRFQQFRG